MENEDGEEKHAELREIKGPVYLLEGQISSLESKINTEPSLFPRASRSLAVQRNCILIASTAAALSSIVGNDYTRETLMHSDIIGDTRESCFIRRNETGFSESGAFKERARSYRHARRFYK